jgi:transcriptional regulator with XRE-family HTH domain
MEGWRAADEEGGTGRLSGGDGREMRKRTGTQEEFERAMRAALKRLGWTQRRLAEELGVSGMRVSNVLNGKHTAGVEVMTRFARAVGLEVRVSFPRARA